MAPGSFGVDRFSLQVARTEAKILIETSGSLMVQVDVKKFASFPGLRDAMHEIQSSHLLVGDFGIHSHHSRIPAINGKDSYGAGC